VVDHGVVVWALPAPGLAEALWLGVSTEVHVCEVNPYKNWLARFVLPLDEVDSPIGDVIVNGDRAGLSQRTRVLADLLADPAEAREALRSDRPMSSPQITTIFGFVV